MWWCHWYGIRISGLFLTLPSRWRWARRGHHSKLKNIMWLNVCDLDKLNNSNPTDKDKELELKEASRSPNRKWPNDFHIVRVDYVEKGSAEVLSHLSLIMSWRFFLSITELMQRLHPWWFIEIPLLRVTTPSTRAQCSQLTSGYYQRCIRQSGRCWENF